MDKNRELQNEELKKEAARFYKINLSYGQLYEFVTKRTFLMEQ
jgi:hypothetical protein